MYLPDFFFLLCQLPKKQILRVVRVEGLKSRIDLNGRVGRVETRAKDGRVGVVFYEESGAILNPKKPISIKLENLVDCKVRPGQDIKNSQAWFDHFAEDMNSMVNDSMGDFLKTGEIKMPKMPTAQQ